MANKMNRLEYLKFIEKGCPYLKNGKCSVCKEIQICCDGRNFIHCYEYEHANKNSIKGHQAEKEKMRSRYETGMTELKPILCSHGHELRNCQRCSEYRYTGLAYCRLDNPAIWDKEKKDGESE